MSNKLRKTKVCSSSLQVQDFFVSSVILFVFVCFNILFQICKHEFFIPIFFFPCNNLLRNANIKLLLSWVKLSCLYLFINIFSFFFIIFSSSFFQHQESLFEIRLIFSSSTTLERLKRRKRIIRSKSICWSLFFKSWICSTNFKYLQTVYNLFTYSTHAFLLV